MRLSHGHNNFPPFTGLCQGQEGARNRSAGHGDALHALLHGVGVLHPDVVHGTPVAAGDGVACQRVGDAGVNAQAVQSGLDAQNVLAHVHEGPCRRAGQPAVLGLAEGGGIAACHHLAVNVGFGAVDLADVLDIGRAGLFVDSKGPVTVAQHGLSTADPGVVVAEDTGILLVARGIAGDLAQIEPVGGVGGLEQYHAVRGVQPLLHAGKRLRGLSALLADARHDAHTLRLNKDLTLGALLAADGLAESIVGTAEPCAVPTGGQGGLLHGINVLAGGSGLLGQIQMVAQLGVFVAVLDEHTGNENAFGHRKSDKEPIDIGDVREAWKAYSINPEKATTKAGLREIIRRERQVELALEGQRYYDIRRWKLASKEFNKPVRGWNVGESTTEDFYRIRYIYNQKFYQRDYLWPIKEQSLIINTNLIQNPGW